ncbi:MAG: hypothetical protein K0Q72_2772, partial [Armatimonadetes bacterium]|nr:hypothetical protein [Armatimonadota bacterium]
MRIYGLALGALAGGWCVISTVAGAQPAARPTAEGEALFEANV